jgi:hypothetical protein
MRPLSAVETSSLKKTKTHPKKKDVSKKKVRISHKIYTSQTRTSKKVKSMLEEEGKEEKEKEKEKEGEEEEEKEEEEEPIRPYIPMRTRISQQVLNTFYDSEGGTGIPVQESMKKNSIRSLSSLKGDHLRETYSDENQYYLSMVPTTTQRTIERTKRRERQASHERFIQKQKQEGEDGTSSSTMPYSFITTSPLFSPIITSNSPLLHALPFTRVSDVFAPSSSLHSSNLMLSAKFNSDAKVAQNVQSLTSLANKQPTAEELVLRSITGESVNITETIPVSPPKSPVLSPSRGKASSFPSSSSSSSYSDKPRATIEAISYNGVLSSMGVYRDSNVRMREAFGEDTELTRELNPKREKDLVELDGIAGVWNLLLFIINNSKYIYTNLLLINK